MLCLIGNPRRPLIAKTATPRPWPTSADRFRRHARQPARAAVSVLCTSSTTPARFFQHTGAAAHPASGWVPRQRKYYEIGQHRLAAPRPAHQRHPHLHRGAPLISLLILLARCAAVAFSACCGHLSHLVAFWLCMGFSHLRRVVPVWRAAIATSASAEADSFWPDAPAAKRQSSPSTAAIPRALALNHRLSGVTNSRGSSKATLLTVPTRVQQLHLVLPAIHPATMCSW